MATRVRKPPPIIDDCLVTHYAVRDRGVRFVGPTRHFVGDKELGAVPCLAIGVDRFGEVVLFYCNHRWTSKGMTQRDSVKDAKTKAERNYPGLGKKWRRTGYSKRRVGEYRRLYWRGLDCTFCGRLPPDFEGMVANKNETTRICNICAADIADILLKPGPATPRP